MNTESFTWLAAAGLLGAFWRQLYALVQRFRSFVVIKTTLRGDVCKAVQNHLWRHYKRSPFSDRFVQSGSAHVRPLGKIQEVAWELPPTQPLIFFRGCKFILLGSMAANGNVQPEHGMATVTTLRGVVDIERLILDAIAEFNSMRGVTGNGRYAVRRVQGFYRNKRMGSGTGYPESNSSHQAIEAYCDPLMKYLGWNDGDIGSAVAVKPMAHLSLPDQIKPAVDEFMRWKESEKWFKEKLIPWRRGWLLYGNPGTGKTSLIRALAQLADMPVWSYDLSSLSNEEMVSNWRSMQESVPCIALIEDIDSSFDGRTNILGENGGGLTFDCLLNCIGGIETCDGVFTVVTTNHVQKVDPALGIPSNGVSSRPGRLDRAIEMPPLSVQNLREIARRILSDWPHLIPKVVQQGDGYTGAQFTELCVQQALDLYWNISKMDTPNHIEATEEQRQPTTN